MKKRQEFLKYVSFELQTFQEQNPTFRDLADPLATTRGSVILTLRLQIAMQQLDMLQNTSDIVPRKIEVPFGGSRRPGKFTGDNEKVQNRA